MIIFAISAARRDSHNFVFRASSAYFCMLRMRSKDTVSHFRRSEGRMLLMAARVHNYVSRDHVIYLPRPDHVTHWNLACGGSVLYKQT